MVTKRMGNALYVAAYPTLLHADTTLATVWGAALRHDIDQSDPLAFYRLQRVKARLRVFQIQPRNDQPLAEVTGALRASLLGELGLGGKENDA